MNLYKEKDKQFTVLFPMGASPQPAQTILSASAQIPQTLQTPSLSLPLSASGAQAPERDKECCVIHLEVRNVGCPRGLIFSNTKSFTPKYYVIKTKS